MRILMIFNNALELKIILIIILSFISNQPIELVYSIGMSIVLRFEMK